MLTLLLLALSLHAPHPVRPAPIIGTAWQQTQASVTLSFGPAH